MKAELSAKALKLVGNPNVLINLISRRVRQLSSGGNRPLIMETAGLSTAEIALTEIIEGKMEWETDLPKPCLLYTSPSPRDKRQSRMPSSA